MENNTKPPLKYLGIFLWALLLFFTVLIASQEYTLYVGEELYLESAPVDPRDLLRWDYVILRYKFESDPILIDYINTQNIPEGSNLYIIFEKNDERLWSVSYISQSPVKDEIFLKIQTGTTVWWRRNIETNIGKYFVPEWTGREIEKIRWDMNVKIKLDSYWSAQIVDLYYEWEKIDPKTFIAK